MCIHRSKNLACTDCSSALEHATDKFDTVLESLQIGDETPSIKNNYMCVHASTLAKT